MTFCTLESDLPVPPKLTFLTLTSDKPEWVGVEAKEFYIDELNLILFMVIGFAILRFVRFSGVILFLIARGLRRFFLGDIILRALDLIGLITGLLTDIF